RERFGITRAEQDELALTSHRRAISAQASGAVTEEIVPVPVVQPEGHLEIRVDEHPRADTTLEKFGAMRPGMDTQMDGATVTAGNASGKNDAASVCIVTSMQVAERHGLEPLARLVGWASAGVAPELMGLGPVPATERALERAGLRLADMD